MTETSKWKELSYQATVSIDVLGAEQYAWVRDDSSMYREALSPGVVGVTVLYVTQEYPQKPPRASSYFTITK